MSIRKRGNVWWMRFTAPDGREIRESAQTTDKRHAQELHDARKAELWRQAKLGEQPRHTWQEAVVRWIEEHPDWDARSGVAISFRQAHTLLGDHWLDDINTEAIAQLARQFRHAGMKPGTINTRTGHIMAVLHAAKRWGWLAAVPAVRRLPVTERRLRWLTRDEADRLLMELPAHLAAMMRFSLATGLREQNVCGLEWTQVDLDRRIAWIHADQAKARKVIPIPLNADAVVVLREQHGQHPRWVFTYSGHRVTRANNGGWHSALQRAGIENFRWHDLRHTWASWHVQAGTPLPVLKELGGWASLDMVLRYAHLGADHLAEHAERISGPRLVSTKSGTALEKATATG